MNLKPLSYNIFVADCIAGMKTLKDESIDLVVTSPPYNLGIKYTVCNDKKTKQDYINWTKEWTTQVYRILHLDGSFFLNLSGSPSNPMMPFIIINELVENVGFTLQNTFHWIKSITVVSKNNEISVGHFKPINSKRYVNDCHEYIFHLTKTGNVELNRLAVGVEYTDKSNIKRWNTGRDKRCRGNNWFIPYETTTQLSKRLHPATFPVKLVENCIKIHNSDENTVMLDPFIGTGTSALAAKNCNIKNFIGYDIEKEYIDIIKNKI